MTWATPECLLIAALIIPLAAALLIPLFHRWPNLRETVTLIAAVLLCLTVIALLGPVLSGVRPQWSGVEVLPGVAFAFKLEPLGMLFALIASSLWIVNSIYSIGYMRANKEPRQTTYYVCFAIALASTMGVAFAENLFTLFLFYEMLTISTYPLVTHRRDSEAMASGRLYLILLLGTSMVLFLPAIAATYVLAGTIDFAPGGILGGKASGATMVVLLVLYLFGIGKAAVMPFHFWLPAAMVAPTPVSALLHAVAVVKAGVFCVVKVMVMIFGVDALAAAGQSGWLTVVAGTTVIVASVVALKQDNLKRRLAYSTVSQLSYVVLGAAILAPISVVGAAMHIAAHAWCKITLFFAAGSIYTAAHLTEVSQLNGIGRRMPWTMAAFAIGALGMIGVPPTAGFLGKWFMLTGAMQTANWLAVAIMVVSTVLNAGYFLPIVFRAFFRAPPEPTHDAHGGHEVHGEAPWPIVLALTATAIGAVALFFLPQIPLALAQMMIGR
ncbi:MAG: monovalent cation/H+ antiporter subunit D family protein [Rhizobiales bacterium]|nr:monovalent cation/H+ antiporter subunit D family protein [Hyphomicrobiales bacterium]